MDQITFHHDTVLSDVHMLLPNARHLMIRLNSVGQPVFISKFKIFSHGESLDNSDPEKGIHEAEKYDDPREDEGKDTEGKNGQEGVEGSLESFLDEDGDLDITHRVAGGLEPIPADIGRKAGYTLGRSPVHRRR